MNVNVALYVDDLTSLEATGNRLGGGDGEWQVAKPLSGSGPAGYFTATQMRQAAEHLAALADDLELREMTVEQGAQL